MASRYWVGGAASWDATAGTKWAVTSGGAGGAAVPTTADDVFFDAASTGPCSVDASAACKSLTFTGYAGTFTGSSAIQIKGDLTLVATMTFDYDGTITWTHTAGTATITTNGVNTRAASVVQNGTGGTLTLGDAWTAAGNLTITNGTFDTNNKNLTFGVIKALRVQNTSTFNCGSSTITTGSAGGVAFDPTITLNQGTSTFVVTTPSTWAPNGKTFHNFTLVPGSGRRLELSGSDALNGDGTFTCAGGALRHKICSDTPGTQRTISFPTTTLSDVVFQDIHGLGGGSWAGTSIGNGGGNTGITPTGARTLYWVGNGGTWSSSTHWSLASGGASGEAPPLPQDSAIIDAASITLVGQTIQVNGDFNSGMDFSAVANNPTVTVSTPSNQTEIYGSLIFGTFVLTGFGLILEGRGSFTFDPKAVTIDATNFGNGLTVNCFGGTYTLAGNLSIGATDVQMANGSFSAGGFNVTCRRVTDQGSTGTVTGGSGTWTLTGTGTVWPAFGSMTVSMASAVVVVSDTGASSKTFAGGGKTYGTLRISGGGAGTVTVTGSNTFGTLTINAPKTVVFGNGTTQTVTTLTATGSSGNVITLRSQSGGVAWTISKSSGIVRCDWLSLTDSHATGGATWYAGANSTNVSGNTGWLFRDPPVVAPIFAGTSSLTATIGFVPPVNVLPPVVTGLARVGAALVCSTGTWNPAASSYSYQWQHSIDGVGWIDVGSDSSTYTVRGSDFDHFIRCIVTGTNHGGSATAESNPVGPVTAVRSTGGTLGCGTYDVYILDRGGATIAVLDFPWNELSWSRVLDDTSDAHVAGAAADCFEAFAEIEPWKHELAVYRDGVLVWVGPVRSPQSNPDASSPSVIAQIDARDLSAWWDRRVIHSDHTYATPTDLATIFEAYANDAMAPDNSPGLTVTASPCGVTGTRTALASQYLKAATELRSLSDIGIDWTIVERQALVGGAVVPTAPIATLTDEHFMLPPIPNRDGGQQGNRFILVGSGVTASGGQGVVGDAYDAGLAAEYGLLEVPSSDLTVTDAASAQAGAASQLAIAGQVTSIENAILAPNAPVTIDELVPGALCRLELAQTNPPISGTYRLQRVSVASSRTNPEIVVCTFQPEGTT